MQVWDLENMLPILTLQRHEKAVHALAVWQDSVFTGSEDMEIKVHSVNFCNLQFSQYFVSDFRCFVISSCDSNCNLQTVPFFTPFL